MDLSLFSFAQRAPETSDNWQTGALRSFKVIATDFILVFHCNRVPIFYSFRDTMIFWSKIAIFFYATYIQL